MKIFLTTLLSICLTISFTYAQKECKPDIDKVDKIDKTVTKVWEIKLGELGFGASLLSKENKDWTAYLRFIRDKNQNYISFMVTQTYAQSESGNIAKFFGGRDLELSLAFEGDLPPVKFQSQIPQHTQSKLLGMVRHEVHLSQILNEEKFNELKNALDKGQVSAFRIVLAGDKRIEKSVKDKRAEDIKEKFNCFYTYAKDNPVADVKSIDISKEFSIDPTTNKYIFTEVVPLQKTQKELYKKALLWLVKYSPGKKVSYENEEEGKAISTCLYKVTYNVNNKVSEDKYTYTASISVKEGKYKYELTDFKIDDGKTYTLEALVEQLKSRPDILEKAFVELKKNINKIIEGLKLEMEGKSDEW